LDTRLQCKWGVYSSAIYKKSDNLSSLDVLNKQVGNAYNNTEPDDLGKGTINILSVILWCCLICGLIGAIIIWVSFGMVSGISSYSDEINPIGVGVGIGVDLFQRVFHRIIHNFQ